MNSALYANEVAHMANTHSDIVLGDISPFRTRTASAPTTVAHALSHQLKVATAPSPSFAALVSSCAGFPSLDRRRRRGASRSVSALSSSSTAPARVIVAARMPSTAPNDRSASVDARSTRAEAHARGARRRRAR
jgi:hypothetical protein